MKISTPLRKTVLSEVIFNDDDCLNDAEGMIIYAEVNAEANPVDGSYECILKGIYIFEVEINNHPDANEKYPSYRRKNLRYLHLDDPVKGNSRGKQLYRSRLH